MSPKGCETARHTVREKVAHDASSHARALRAEQIQPRGFALEFRVQSSLGLSLQHGFCPGGPESPFELAV